MKHLHPAIVYMLRVGLWAARYIVLVSIVCLYVCMYMDVCVCMYGFIKPLMSWVIPLGRGH